MNEHEKAGKPINYIPSSASHNCNVQWISSTKGKRKVFTVISEVRVLLPPPILKTIGGIDKW